MGWSGRAPTPPAISWPGAKRTSVTASGGVLAAAVGRPQEVLDGARELSGVEPAGRAVQPLDHGEPGDFTPEVSVEKLFVVLEGHAGVRLAIGAQHVGVGENAGAAVHPAVVDRVEADGANAYSGQSR
jgi:hypothetical protein